ncbi:hypothetical protein [Shinella sp. BYT-45]|uniref:hypothetical protein n=1 Tax=Shinella sp. BYT-45 TaxID=3377377 RepID=UPI0039811F77
MDKEAEVRKAKKGGRDDTKPGTIVAGPEAHARERAGKAPSPRGAKPKDEASKKPASRTVPKTAG